MNGDPRVACSLTELGRQQAEQLGERLVGEPLDLCVVTEFPRTLETADIVLEDRDVPRLVVPELNDPYYGAFEGRIAPRLSRLGGKPRAGGCSAGRGRDQARDRKAISPRLRDRARAVGGAHPRHLPFASDRLRARLGRRTWPAGEDADHHLRGATRPPPRRARAGDQAAKQVDEKPRLPMIRRLLIVAAVLWVLRWAVLFAASELERRRPQ